MPASIYAHEVGADVRAAFVKIPPPSRAKTEMRRAGPKASPTRSSMGGTPGCGSGSR